MNFELKHVFLVVGSGATENYGVCNEDDLLILLSEYDNPVGKKNIFFICLKKICNFFM